MEKIKKFKLILKKEKIDGYLIPKNDEFFSEYVSDCNDRLNYISNFNGSFGFSLILKDKNYLFVDGRYTLQALKQSGKFFKVITFPKKMPKDIFKKEISIGFDPKLFTKKMLKSFFNKSKCKLVSINKNLIDEIWRRKIKKNNKKIFNLPRNSGCEPVKSKINKIANYLKKIKADYQFITASENNAWLLNIRGLDEKYSPIPHSYILIDKNKNVRFYCNLNKVPSALKKNPYKINFFNIGTTHEDLSKISKKKFLIDKNTCSIYFENIISKKNEILNLNDPIYNLKSIKNKKEIKNIQLAHILDGAALTKYLFWLKRNFQNSKVTELSAAKKLYELRKINKNFNFLSFPTISGSGPNGAIIHYKPTKRTDRTLKTGDIYLVDSGGQYKFGTTDVTRTISLDNSSKRIKNIFTRVLKGHIAVSSYKFQDNTTGSEIDKVARKYLKQIGLDYSHGTGHGVGYFLNVHEGPHAITKNNKIRLKEGMIISNEPGYYEKNKFGIRIENLIYVKKINKKIFFENLTLAPIDKSLLDMSILNKNEIDWINDYHKKVHDKLKYLMNNFEISELKRACSPI